MVSITESYSAPASARARRRVSPQIVLGFARVIDLVIVGGLGMLSLIISLNGAPPVHPDIHILALLAAMLISGIVFSWFRLYDERLLMSGESAIKRIWTAWFVTVSAFLLTAFLLTTLDEHSRIWFILWVAGGAVALPIHRFALKQTVKAWADRGFLEARTVIVGAGPHGTRLAQHLREHGRLQTRIIGFVDDRVDRLPPRLEGYPVLGNYQTLEEMVRREEIDEVIVALPWSAEERLHELTHRLSTLPVQVRLAPDLAGFQYMQRSFSFLAGLPTLNVFERPMSGWSSIIKSIEDRLLGALLVLPLAPLFLAIALAVKLDSRGPVFFRQKRYGFNNKLIPVYKFRTMYTDMSDETAKQLATKNDPRVTRVGRFLRATSLDELPQLLNVLTGEMSLVGPRPHAEHASVEGKLYWEVVEDYAARHKVKPGITGWAQVNGWRGETDTDEKIRKRVEHDLYYIEHWSPWLDIQILFKTFFVVLKGENAY